MSSLLNKTIVYSITPFTTTDYQEHLSCIIWFISCNMRCQYCYNDDIVYCKEGQYTFNDVLTFLQKRQNLLNAVVLSGGEATLHDLVPLCKEIKKLGFKIKLDTNGLNPKRVEQLIQLNLIDYIALDFKAHEKKYYFITQTNQYQDFLKTLRFLIKKDFSFEVRTTVHSDLLDEDDINTMIEILNEEQYKNTYYLQMFLQTPTNINNLEGPKNSFDRSKIKQTDLVVSYRN